MQIKGVDGGSYSVTSQGQGNLNTVLGAIGTFGALGGNLGGILGGWGNNNCGCSENTMVNRYELSMAREADSLKSENALLRSQVYTDQKLVETTAYLQGEIGKVATKLENFKDAQNAVNLQQATYNATATANISCISGQIAQLQSLSQLIVPSRNVCDTCCPCNQ